MFLSLCLVTSGCNDAIYSLLFFFSHISSTVLIWTVSQDLPRIILRCAVVYFQLLSKSAFCIGMNNKHSLVNCDFPERLHKNHQNFNVYAYGNILGPGLNNVNISTVKELGQTKIEPVSWCMWHVMHWKSSFLSLCSLIYLPQFSQVSLIGCMERSWAY